ncbi:MAG: DUF5317 family protein [Patescibacteria group bacterium]
MNGYWADFLLIHVIPSVFLGIGATIYYYNHGRGDLLRKFAPILLFSVISILKRFGFFNDNQFCFFLILFVLVSDFLILNYRNIGIALFACGGISNALVSLVNGGKMPVHSLESVSGFYQPMTESTIFPFLCDWILSPFHNYLMSFGDILLIIGTAIFLAQELAGLWKNFRKDKNK